jgi:2-polyprenyl-3-methyl-5-hydroxy-6-metoxy-1,4-benzoquinol methylase
MSDRFPDWPSLYRDQSAETMPWYFADLDPDVEQELATLGITRGRVLDIGTGPGTQAIELAARGFDVTGTDIAEAAIESARARARAKGVNVDFVVDDVLDSRVSGCFDVVIDRGCFHVFAPARRGDYVRTVADRLGPGGHLLLKCFSHLQPGDVGPYKFTADDIALCFTPAFDLVSARATIYHGTLEQKPQALSCVLVRR